MAWRSGSMGQFVAKQMFIETYSTCNIYTMQQPLKILSTFRPCPLSSWTPATSHYDRNVLIRGQLPLRCRRGRPLHCISPSPRIPLRLTWQYWVGCIAYAQID